MPHTEHGDVDDGRTASTPGVGAKGLLHRQGASPRHHIGQALVEMAIIVLLMITLAVATIDFGVYMYRFVQTGNCVREAARRASVHDPNAGAGDESDYCIDRALDGELTLSYSMDGDIEQVTATINTTYNWMALDDLLHLLTFGSASLDPGPLRASSTMRVEGEVSP